MPELPRSLQLALDSLYNYKPPKLASSHGAYTKLKSPVTFYDKHLDPRLALHTIILAPSLIHNLVAATKQELQKYEDRTDVEFPSLDNGFIRPGQLRHTAPLVTDARSVGILYAKGVAKAASTIASMLVLHPDAPRWTRSLSFMEERSIDGLNYAALNEDHAPLFQEPYDEATSKQYAFMVKEATWDAMDGPTKQNFQEAHRRHRMAAVWQMFFVRREARRALKRMDTILNNESTYPTFGTTTSNTALESLILPFSPDALMTAWGEPLDAFVSAAPHIAHSKRTKPTIDLRRSNRIAALTKQDSRETSKKKTTHSTTSKKVDYTTVITPASLNAPKTDEEMATSILHHAWARAVERDSTFIVLHCGGYERIAFRHRSTQTLFVSDLINVNKCSDPGYGSIHLGLFVSILSDALDRAAQRAENPTQTSKKRRRSVVASDEPRKRPRTRTTVASEAKKKLIERQQLQAVIDEISPRQLALLRMQYDRFNSPVPASFVRCNPTRKTGKSTYKPTEYFHLTVSSYIGDGATGDIYGATVELLGTDGRIHSFPNVVVKFASLPEQRQRLRHEYKVYQRLKLSEITCVPHIFGLFKDAEGDTLALVMTNGGKSLASRRLTPDSYAFSVSKDEREKLIEALQSIHDQGFRHRDIRPENLLVAEDGEVQIIDFDRASLNSSEQTRQREMEHLFRVLEGPNKDFCGILGISVGSFCDSERASSGTPRGWEDTPDNSDVD